MSLLLDALKKAELAKQAAKEPSDTGLSSPAARDPLPDRSGRMEIQGEDLRLSDPEPPVTRAEKPVLELAPDEPPARVAPPRESEPPPRPIPALRPAPAQSDHLAQDEAVERKQARQVFEAKELDINPRKPFYLAVGALGVFAVGTIAYFWYQLQPRSASWPSAASTRAAPRPAVAVPAAPAALSEPAASATLTPPVPPRPAAPAIPAPHAAPAPTATVATTPSAPRGPMIARRSAPASRDASATSDAARRTQGITITPARVQTDPLLEGAYLAYNAGDLTKAKSDYQQVLQNHPDNRDALLGLAAVETQAGHFDAADRHYTRLLELDPRDVHAQAGQMGLRGQVDPSAAESRLKSLIAAQPEASFLHFTLGNQLAAQGRWPEAQQAYFQAYSGDTENADFAYNLAISLDRLRQPKQALEYYRRALALLAGRPVSFDKAQVAKRIAQLER